MSMAHLAPELFDQVHMLTPNEKGDPESFFQGIFLDHRLHELKDFLWDAMNVILTTDDAPFEDPTVRKDATLYMHIIVKCLEAGKLIGEAADKKPIEPSSDNPPAKYRDIQTLTSTELQSASEYFANRQAYFANKMSEASTIYHSIMECIINKLQSNVRSNLAEPKKFKTSH